MKSPDFARQSPREERVERITFAKHAAYKRIALMDPSDNQEGAMEFIQHLEEIALNGKDATVSAAIIHAEDQSKRLLHARVFVGHDDKEPPVCDVVIPYAFDQEIPIIPFFEELMPEIIPGSTMNMEDEARDCLFNSESDGIILQISGGSLARYEHYESPMSPFDEAV